MPEQEAKAYLEAEFFSIAHVRIGGILWREFHNPLTHLRIRAYTRFPAKAASESMLTKLRTNLRR
jgi:hypothetical protein